MLEERNDERAFEDEEEVEGLHALAGVVQEPVSCVLEEIWIFNALLQFFVVVGGRSGPEARKRALQQRDAF
jgi:hypothetical protein